MAFIYKNDAFKKIHCLAHTMLKDGSITQEEMIQYDKLCLIGVGSHEHSMDSIELTCEQISQLWAKISSKEMKSIVAGLPLL